MVCSLAMGTTYPGPHRRVSTFGCSTFGPGALTPTRA
jgi:hypothetical protein